MLFFLLGNWFWVVYFFNFYYSYFFFFAPNGVEGFFAFRLSQPLSFVSEKTFPGLTCSPRRPSFSYADHRVGLMSRARRQQSFASAQRVCFSQTTPRRQSPQLLLATLSQFFIFPGSEPSRAFSASLYLLIFMQLTANLQRFVYVFASFRMWNTLQCLFSARQQSARSARVSQVSFSARSRSARKVALEGTWLWRDSVMASISWVQRVEQFWDSYSIIIQIIIQIVSKLFDSYLIDNKMQSIISLISLFANLLA